jgi:glutathione synthase/RimK-type ligase-like ATP-grasp enzyme
MNGKSQSGVKGKQASQGIFDLAIAWNWEYDRYFVSQINDTCLKEGLKPYLIQPFNLNEILQLLTEEKIKFRVFLDRASDTDFRFVELAQLLQEKGASFIDHPEGIKWIDDKILIHMDFTLNNIPVPATFIYYPTDERRMIMNKIKQIGVPFVIKPAHSVETGGLGVLLNAHSVEDVYRWHSLHNNFIFLLQQQIIPCLMDKRPAWFRVFYILGKILPCWWNPSTHIYNVVTQAEVNKFSLKPLYRLTEQIAKIYKLGFFSTEIAVEKGKDFVVVDYINNQCDMRKKSRFFDGVCDETVDLIVDRLVEKNT